MLEIRKPQRNTWKITVTRRIVVKATSVSDIMGASLNRETPRTSPRCGIVGFKEAPQLAPPICRETISFFSSVALATPASHPAIIFERNVTAGVYTYISSIVYEEPYASFSKCREISVSVLVSIFRV